MNGRQGHLLIVEDDPRLQREMQSTLHPDAVVVAGDREAAIAQLRRHEPGVVTLDLGLPPQPDGPAEGLATLQQILALAPDTKVIVGADDGDHESAARAVGLGAYDLYQKPYDADVLRWTVARAFRLRALEGVSRRLQHAQDHEPLGIITRNERMLAVCRQVEKAGRSDATVLLIGESGTGKELLAHALHQRSRRAKKRFVAINCAAIPDNLLESELFGYEKGAYTGAMRQTQGKIECAHGGTFFLDEIGDLSPALQAKLLRFLSERVVERIGGREEIPVDVRVVGATHQDLRKLAAQGRFREDLYYRLTEIVLEVPPLRERGGDPTLLAHAFMNRFRKQEGRYVRGYSIDAIDAIETHSWPGNVREMENCVKRAVIMGEGSLITAADLGLAPPQSPQRLNLRQVREEAERLAVVRALSRADWNIVRAARLLGVSRPTLYDLIQRHELRQSSAHTVAQQ